MTVTRCLRTSLYQCWCLKPLFDKIFGLRWIFFSSILRCKNAIWHAKKILNKCIIFFRKIFWRPKYQTYLNNTRLNVIFSQKPIIVILIQNTRDCNFSDTLNRILWNKQWFHLSFLNICNFDWYFGRFWYTYFEFDGKIMHWVKNHAQWILYCQKMYEVRNKIYVKINVRMHQVQ